MNDQAPHGPTGPTTNPDSEPVTGPGSGQNPALKVTATLLVIVVAATAWWWVGRAADARAVAAELAEYAGAPLPLRGAPVDTVLANIGAALFQSRCAACHNIHGEEKLGPNLSAVTFRRDYGWIRSMILDPDSMTRFDPSARALREAYDVQMLVLGEVGEGHALALIEFLRRVDAGSDQPGA